MAAVWSCEPSSTTITSRPATPPFLSALSVASTRSMISRMPRSSLRAGIITESVTILSAGIIRPRVDAAPMRTAACAVNLAQHSRRNAPHHRMRRHVARDDCPGGDHRPPANAYPVGDHCRGPQPDVVFNDDAFGGDALVDERPRRIVKNVIDRDDLGVG